MNPRSRLVGLLVSNCVVALLLVLAVNASAQSPSLVFGRCQSMQVLVHVAGLQCGTLDVPFDRADPAIGNIALAVQRVPASAPRVGVIVLLAGGPGQPALPAFDEMLAPLAREPSLRGYELVAFDQRGTGQSGGLVCPGEEPSNTSESAYIGSCGSALGPTRIFYSSQESVEDLDALRQALGGTPLSLFAVSYGGRVAGIYAREHPQDVARMVLDSPSPVTGSSPLDSQRLLALRRVLDQGICGAGACRSFSSDVYADLARLVAKLHRSPLHTKIYNSHGRLQPATVTETSLLQLLTALDLSPAVRELAPAAIASAVHGYVEPLARLTRSLRSNAPGSGLIPTSTVTSTSGLLDGTPWASELPESDSVISMPLFAATYCRENEMPWSSESPPAGRTTIMHHWLASLPAGSTAPFAPATVAAQSALTLCIDWPATPPAPPTPTGVSAAPTLILSGDDDLRTPYEQDLTVAAGYGEGQLLRVPGVGHSTVSTDSTGCAKRAMIEFLTAGQAPASCPASKEPGALPLPPASLGDLRPLPSHSPLVGRVTAAVAITLEDFEGQIDVGGPSGGLRGGYWRLDFPDLIVHDFVDVHGVSISGTVTSKGAHFTVHGRLNGILIQKGLDVTGRLGGKRVHLRLVIT